MRPVFVAGLLSLAQTPYSRLGEALSKGRMARYPPHWMIRANWLAQGDRQCASPCRELDGLGRGFLLGTPRKCVASICIAVL